MKRIIFHWTAGRYKASKTDRKHYHYIVEDDGNVVKGDHDISANAKGPLKSGQYAAHTRGCNTGSIGIAAAAMFGAKSVTNVGNYPITETQFEEMCQLIASMCIEYTIPVTSKTVLSHAEVEDNLGKKQRGKWDIAVLEFIGLKGAPECGYYFRKRIKEIIAHRSAIKIASNRSMRSNKVVEDAAAVGRTSSQEIAAGITAAGIVVKPIADISQEVAAIEISPVFVYVGIAAAVCAVIYIVKERRRKRKDALDVLNS